MRGNHLKSSKKILGFFLKKKCVEFQKITRNWKNLRGEIHLKTWNIFFLQWLRWFFATFDRIKRRSGLMFHVVFRIFYQLLTSLYRPECVNHVSKSWLFLCWKRRVNIWTWTSTHPSSFKKERARETKTLVCEPTQICQHFSFYFYQSNIFFLCTLPCCRHDFRVLDRSRREVSNSKLNQKRTLTLFRLFCNAVKNIF